MKTSWLIAAVLAAPLIGCGDEAETTDTSTASGAGGSTSSSAGAGGKGSGAGGGNVDTNNYVRGTFHGIDGSEEAFAATAQLREVTVGGVPTFSCGGEQTNRFLLGITYQPDNTSVGTFDSDLLMGPYVVLGWAKPGGGAHGTSSSQGTVTFTEFGTSAGDVVAGTATAPLSPEPNDPDDLYEEVTDIEFRCVVP